MTVRYKTKEDFEKDFNRTYYSGKAAGLEDGRVEALSYIIGPIFDVFTDAQINEAVRMYKDRKLKIWWLEHGYDSHGHKIEEQKKNEEKSSEEKSP